VPVVLQQGVKYLMTHLCQILARAWSQVKVTFIYKPCKVNYTKVTAYRPISLSIFTLKTTEKLVDRHTRDEILGLHPLQ